jgi:hypothetical protein
MTMNAPLAFVLIMLLQLPAFTQQQKESGCSSIKYESRNQIDPPPLSVSVISGQVVDEVGELGGSTTIIGPVDRACVGLFTEKGYQLKATVVADDEGRFTFENIPSGKYRLVVSAGSLCTANVPLRVAHGKREEENKGKQIVIHMRAAGYDACSYGDYK